MQPRYQRCENWSNSREEIGKTDDRGGDLLYNRLEKDSARMSAIAPKPGLPRLSLRKIALFVATADAGSVSAAARLLSIGQTSLSEALMDLERDIGVDLFVRHKARGVTLTSAGQELLVEARDLVRRAESFEALTRRPGANLSGTITVGCFPTLLPVVGPPLIDGVQSRHPGVHLRFIENNQPDLERALLAGTVEVSILYGVDIVSALNQRHLFVVTPYVLLPQDHRLAQTEAAVDLTELVDEPLIQMDIFPGKTDYVFASVGVAPHPAHRTTNFELVRALVARKLGYSVLVQRPVTNVSYEGLPLAIRPIANAIPPLHVVMAWPGELHLHPRVAALVDFAESIFARETAAAPEATLSRS
jgi:DNA-binding transcriptional LysR family regulator